MFGTVSVGGPVESVGITAWSKMLSPFWIILPIWPNIFENVSEINCLIIVKIFWINLFISVVIAFVKSSPSALDNKLPSNIGVPLFSSVAWVVFSVVASVVCLSSVVVLSATTFFGFSVFVILTNLIFCCAKNAIIWS